MDIIESLLTCSKDERIQAWKLLNVHPDTLPLFESKVNDLIQIALEKANLVSKDDVKEIVKDELDTSFDNRLITSDLEVLPRLRSVEKVTGIYEFEDFEEHEPTIPEQITELKERIEKGIVLPLEPEDDNRETFDPTSKVKKGFVELIKFVESRPVIDGSKSITNSVLKHFRKHVLPEELRPKESASREWKSELKEVIKQEAPCVKIDKKKNGDSRGTRFVFPKNFNNSMTKCKLPVSY